jgi:hypothetical protein
VFHVLCSFTKQHIERLWPTSRIEKCCPPATALEKFSSLRSNAEELLEKLNVVNILSLSQFRPEKNHKAQLDTLAILKKAGKYEV